MMGVQRLRNLTTGILHTKIEDVYQDIEILVGVEGVMTHQLPNATKALEPWLREQVDDSRFWDGKFDQTHAGSFDGDPMTAADRAAFWERYSKLPSLLAGKHVMAVSREGAE